MYERVCSNIYVYVSSLMKSSSLPQKKKKEFEHYPLKKEKEFEYYIDKIKIWGLRSYLVSIVCITYYSFFVGPRLKMCV